jgi:HD-GYP domain-containing protein (c-di-GMP phosphodiesterase class II)
MGFSMLSRTTSIIETAAPAGSSKLLSLDLFGRLAERFRPAGLLLVAFAGDGTVLFTDTDSATSEFFRRYVVPALHKPAPPIARPAGMAPHPQNAACALPTNIAWRQTPGTVMTGFAHSGKRQSEQLYLALVARSPEFDQTEEVLRTCGRLGLDARWLETLAAELPAYGPAALARQVKILADTLTDQLRVEGLQHEVDTLSQQLTDTYEELSLIYQLSGGMKVNRGPGDFFKQACIDVMQVMDVRGMGVSLCVEMQDCPPPSIYGRVALSMNDVQRLSDQLMGVLRQRKNTLLIPDLSSNPTFAWLGEHARQLLAAPLMRQDQVLGCLFAIDKEEGDFDSVDSKLLNSIADESGIYLENATLFEDVHGLMMGLLHSLTSAVDAKDAYTCGHSERVALLTRHIAQQAGLKDADVERFYMSGLLHDVGKIGVPEAVLQKAGRLTNEEFEQMKKHPEIGARILADVKQMKPIIPGVLHHHERFDGKGYPHGLSGEKIPLMGRIICLADCFDAMTSNRTYRRALPIEVAMSEIRRCSGTQFDPALSEAFLRSTPDDLRELLKDHKDRSKRLLELQETLRGK